MKIILALLFLFIPLCLLALDGYDVVLSGEIPLETQLLLKTASQLILLKESPPSTLTGLRNRAESDIENILKVLHSQAYFNARVTLSYDFECSSPLVNIHIDLGPVYPIATFRVLPAKDSEEPFSYAEITLDELNICLGSPAYPKTILAAEEKLILLMALWSYPLAKIQRREIVADQAIKAIHVTLYMNSGPLAHFGPITLQGACEVEPEFFQKKIAWYDGEPYCPAKIERTKNALEASGLFSSISIFPEEQTDEESRLPMTIEVVEGKKRSIAWGLVYNTERGAGVAFEWEHRNIRGLGEKLRFDTDIWSRQQEAHLLYLKPDFLCPGQDLLWLAEVSHERTRGYVESSVSASGSIERQWDDETRFSYGLMYKWLHDSRGERIGTFNLCKTPMYIRWSNANNLLDPTAGNTVIFKFIPTVQIGNPEFAYGITTLTWSRYDAITEDGWWTIASRIIFGSIFGSSRVPTSEKLFEGSDSVMRGYHYLSVSPLDHRNRPIGGRSMLIYSTELRVRATDCFGWVLFYDIGNVCKTSYPHFHKKQLQSTGFGLRYHTPVGPLRLDLAVPLNRRPGLDPRYQIYLSIGQAF